jgi:hypothetical protein
VKIDPGTHKGMHSVLALKLGVTVYCPDVPLGTGDPWAQNFQRSSLTLRDLSVVCAAVAQSILGCAISVVWMGTSSTSIVVHELRSQSLLCPRHRCHRRLLLDTGYDHGAACAMALASSIIAPGDDGLDVATKAPPDPSYVAAVHNVRCSSTRDIAAQAHWQEVLGTPMLQRCTCCRVHPTICKLPYGRQNMGSSVAVVDVAIPHETRCAQELLHPMPAFLKMTHAV